MLLSCCCCFFLSWRGATTFAFTFCCHLSFCFRLLLLLLICSTLLGFILTVDVVVVGNWCCFLQFASSLLCFASLFQNSWSIDWTCSLESNVLHVGRFKSLSKREIKPRLNVLEFGRAVLCLPFVVVVVDVIVVFVDQSIVREVAK